jgi:hypothetical protein
VYRSSYEYVFEIGLARTHDIRVLVLDQHIICAAFGFELLLAPFEEIRVLARDLQNNCAEKIYKYYLRELNKLQF